MCRNGRTSATSLIVFLLLGCARQPQQSLNSVSSSPAVFSPGVISDANEQWRIAFTPDGREAFFAGSERFFPVSRAATIYRSVRNGASWSAPEVAPFSGRFPDIDPALSADGQRLFFSSIRPIDGSARTDLDIWMVERRGSGWSEPVRLGAEVNSATDELYPSLANDGTLYFASGPIAPKAGEHWDIYRATSRGDGFNPRERLGAGVNTAPSSTDPHLQAAWDFNPEISPDGRTLVFTSLRPGGFGLGDLYVSTLEGNAWSPAQNLGSVVNTAADEYHATLSRDRRTLFFVRRGPGPGDFYSLNVSAIPVLARALTR